MTEEKVIIELDIKTDKALADTIALKESVIKLTDEAKKLKETEGETSEAYVKKETTMVLKTFTIRDSKGEFYSPPFFQKTHGVGIVTGKQVSRHNTMSIVTGKHRDWETVSQSRYNMLLI